MADENDSGGQPKWSWRKVEKLQSPTHRSPQDPDAILSPIFNNLLSISQSPGFAPAADALSIDERGCEEPDHEPCVSRENSQNILFIV